MSQFTPGPYCDNGDGAIRQAEDNEGHRLFIAQIIEIPFNFGGDKTTEANINLLRSAPEMYEALKAIADQGEPARTHDELWSAWQVRVRDWKSAVSALAKADGKPTRSPAPTPPASRREPAQS